MRPTLRPHSDLGFCDEVVLDALMDCRAALKPAADAAGVKLTYLPLILKATSLALARHPALNAVVAADASEVTERGAHNIGVAMDTPRGLIVPNVKDVRSLTVLEVAAELARLQALAAAGKLGEADLADGTFTCGAERSVSGGVGRGGTRCTGHATREQPPPAARARAHTTPVSPPRPPRHCHIPAQPVQHREHWRHVREPDFVCPAGVCR